MQIVQAALLRTLFQLFSLLPLSWVQNLGGFLGRCACWAGGKAVLVTRRNIELCFPELGHDDCNQLVEDSLVETGKLALEMVKIWSQPAARSLTYVRDLTQRVAQLRELGAGRGILIVAPHLGNWEILNFFLGQNFPTSVLYQPPKMRVLDEIIARSRKKTGSQVFPTNRKGVAAMFAALRKGELVGILPDQEPELDGGVYADFFGIPALTMTLVPKLAQKTEAAVIFAYAKRLPDARGYELVFHKAGEKIYSSDLGESVAELNRGVEQCVLGAIEQYQWEYKRFRKSEKGRNFYYQFG